MLPLGAAVSASVSGIVAAVLAGALATVEPVDDAVEVYEWRRDQRISQLERDHAVFAVAVHDVMVRLGLVDADRIPSTRCTIRRLPEHVLSPACKHNPLAKECM